MVSALNAPEGTAGGEARGVHLAGILFLRIFERIFGDLDANGFVSYQY
jgi:hypothetical protein